MRAYGGGRVGPFFNPETFQQSARIDIPVESKTGLQRQYHRVAARVVNRHGVLERAGRGTRAPAPDQLQPGRIGDIHELDERRLEAAGGAIEVPDHRAYDAVNLHTVGQRLRGTIEPRGAGTAKNQRGQPRRMRSGFD